MTWRLFLRAGAAILVLVLTAGVPATGQSSARGYNPPKSTCNPPKTPWGDPDLQGIYDYQDLVPMQRPAEFAGKATLTEAEYTEWAKKHQPTVFGYNDWWNNRNFIKDFRTSLIVD